MLRKKSCIFIALVVLLAAGATWAAQPLPDIVAVVNGENIRSVDLTSMLIDWQAPMVLEEMINFKIIGQEAKKAGIIITADQVKAKIEEFKKDAPPGQSFEEMLMQRGLTPGHAFAVIKMQMQTEAILKKTIKVTDDDLNEYRRASHILIMGAQPPFPGAEEAAADADMAKKDQEAKDKIEKIAQEIKDGLSFEEAAKKYSEDPGTKDNGGDLNYFTAKRMMPEFSKAAFELKAGEMSGVVKTSYGYHLIKLTSIGKDATGEDRKQLEDMIMEQKIGEAYRTWMMEVKSKAKVKNIINPAKPAPKKQTTAPKVNRTNQPKPATPTPAPTEATSAPTPAPEEAPPAPPAPPTETAPAN